MKNLFTLIFALFFVCGISAQDGLIAHFQFDGDATDASGNGNDGYVEGPTLCPDRFGDPNKAYRFSSTQDRIAVDSDLSLNINNYDAFTMSLWIKRSFFDYSNYNPILLIIGQNTLNYALMVDPEFAYGLPSPQYQNQLLFTNYSSSGNYDLLINPATVADTLWHQIVYVVKQTEGKVEAYLDGTALGTADYTHNPLSNFSLTIGNHMINDWAFIGDMDDVRIYDHALTTDEINATLSTESAQLTQLTLFPNPCDEQINIKTDALEVNYLDLYNIYGELVRTTPLTATTTVSVADLPSGVYIASLRKDSQHVHAEKVIIAHDIRTP